MPLNKALLGACLLTFSFTVSADIVEGIALPGQPLELDATPLDGNNFTGARILNQEDTQNPQANKFDITIEQLDNNPFVDNPLPNGFKLLDNTLRVTSSNPGGKRFLRIRMDYGRFGGRAGLRRLGIRANTIRILRTTRASGRWSTAVRRMNEQRIANQQQRIGLRYRRLLTQDDFKSQPFAPGREGTVEQKQFAWTIIDTRYLDQGEQYFALAGAAVPLPAAWLLFLSGSGLLFWVSRNRRGATAAQ